jgi:light-regulated signal transduction histidine kinase (bacteriophytochrome)
MDVIQNSARRMGQLVDDLLSFSRMQRTAMSRQVLNMDEITDEVLNNLSGEITKNGIFIKRNPLPAVRGDQAMLNIMLTNLISNAVKFTSKSEKRLVEIGYEPDKNIFFVRDTGVGFEMKYADKLFGVFHRLHSDKEFEGTGIGLATVKNIIERHDGSIRAESEPGKGTCFYFSLPLAEK